MSRKIFVFLKNFFEKEKVRTRKCTDFGGELKFYINTLFSNLRNSEE